VAEENFNVSLLDVDFMYVSWIYSLHVNRRIILRTVGGAAVYVVHSLCTVFVSITFVASSFSNRGGKGGSKGQFQLNVITQLLSTGVRSVGLMPMLTAANS